MNKPLPFVCALLACGLMGPLAHGQDRLPGQDAPLNASDPRNAKDPRDVADPRQEEDPREVEPDPLLGPPGPELYDALYAAGLETKLKQAFGENGWSLLPYLDAQCEAWLALRERGDAATPTGQQKLATLEAKARDLARMADERLLDTRFQRYVLSVFAWTEEQQLQARSGQELYRQGVALAAAAREAHEALAAMTPLRQSLDHARRLGDTWVQSMALVAIGNLEAGVRDEQAARATMEEAVRIGREIRDLDGVWTALSVLYESGIRTSDLDQAQAALQEQYLIAQDVADPATLQRVLEQLVSLEAYREDLK